MFIDGVNIMILGTGIVFAFLVIICVSMIASSKLIQKFQSCFESSSAKVGGSAGTNQDDELIAVISAAVTCSR